MKKKLIIILLVCILLCGCKSIQDMSLDEVVNTSVANSVKVYNKYRKGYKYYLSKGLEVISNNEYNEIIVTGNYKYYLYVDVVSYYNKVIDVYDVNDKSYVSKQINYEDKYGYLEINALEDGKYFIEIMYNYAKIEVIVEEKDINITIANSLNILNSIKYDINVLKMSLEEEVSKFKEYDYNIFETTSTKQSEYLQAVSEDIYDDGTEDEYDTDLIK